jgi:hypothetical protein
LEYILSHILRQAIPTNNGKVADDISIRYQSGEGGSWRKD